MVLNGWFRIARISIWMNFFIVIILLQILMMMLRVVAKTKVVSIVYVAEQDCADYDSYCALFFISNMISSPYVPLVESYVWLRLLYWNVFIIFDFLQSGLWEIVWIVIHFLHIFSIFSPTILALVPILLMYFLIIFFIMHHILCNKYPLLSKIILLAPLIGAWPVI